MTKAQATRRWSDAQDRRQTLQPMRAAIGQKLVILSFLLNMVTIWAWQTHQQLELAQFLLIWSVVMSFMGVWMVGRGLQFPMWGRIVALVCLLIPPANLVILLSLSVRTTNALRDAGYDVGLFGAR